MPCARWRCYGQNCRAAAPIHGVKCAAKHALEQQEEFTGVSRNGVCSATVAATTHISQSHACEDSYAAMRRDGGRDSRELSVVCFPRQSPVTSRALKYPSNKMIGHGRPRFLAVFISPFVQQKMTVCKNINRAAFAHQASYPFASLIYLQAKASRLAPAI